MEWQPIETAPDDGAEFIGKDSKSGDVYKTKLNVFPEGTGGERQFKEGKGPKGIHEFVEDGKSYWWWPTHWMPLPDLPKVE